MSALTPQSDMPTPTTDKITQAAMETIYLCKFRVSMDGEWLCLRELDDISLTPDPEPTHEDSWEDLTDVVEQLRDDTEDPNYLMANERMNLMNMAKLSIKGLIESALNLGRTLDSDYAPLQQFFVVMEHCLKHGLKAKKTFLGQNKSFWGPLELVEKLVPEAAEITASVKDLPGLKTPVGRGRAWLRLALMQKKLSEYMKALINRKDLLSEFYEPNALMMEEEGAIIAGLLVGLNVIDANFCMKGEDLDSQVGVIDFSMYLKDGNSTKGSEGDGQITAILDQKNYVEELNRHLSATVNNLQAKVDALEKSNTKLTEELAVANNRIITLQEEMERVKEESSYILESSRKATKDRTADGQALTEARKQLKEETQLRLDVEKELEAQIGMRQEMELAMKMLEKDVCEKQDALVALRQQLDDLRALKHELSFKLQSSDMGVKQKSELNSRLEEKTNQMAATIKQLEQRLRQAEKDRQLAQQDNRLFKQEFGDKINSLQLEVEELSRQRSHLELELRRERDRWSHSHQRSQESKKGPKNWLRQDGKLKIQEENPKLKQPLGENSVLPHRSASGRQEEQEQLSGPGHAEICQLCQEEDSRSQRKNICKNCGGIFCEACSVHELPLPSSINPERVCNPCHQRLIQQYSSSPL
ncbi:protein RUFY3 isoform X1 [Hirundo rustica]|uniref:protein RUFY3 isoform X1 n=3 Tax=Hirundo rustica TaxID=43150 RepID=UPI001A9494D3|nr:protein RUFY3 isoform X1 [Hirundo rustica]XP_039921798.1 protein RUFY3 isoform X1 [Hirundo rustica]XP_039921799.1 protein RUFY3 isoform X1 [Hirundo rustica]XP_039921800.1 protein RUFY3 isoform X1 [Hirundo rustica]XP_039921801.1 protein RUFY3 isoform X1 [Hirundo rustica]